MCPLEFIITLLILFNAGYKKLVYLINLFIKITLAQLIIKEIFVMNVKKIMLKNLLLINVLHVT